MAGRAASCLTPQSMGRDRSAGLLCCPTPKLYAVVESHPNVEKHDVRMGHPELLMCTGPSAL
jgi:hypothetical protein